MYFKLRVTVPLKNGGVHTCHTRAVHDEDEEAIKDAANFFEVDPKCVEVIGRYTNESLESMVCAAKFLLNSSKILN